jgi:2-polyprenyl-3-methyl-5-hydroxy-6-metoxy-1,4-benzoquinol methylase
MSFVQNAGAAPRRDILKPALQRLLGKVKGLRALDAGCGEGDLSRWLADQGAVVTGIDHSDVLLRAAALAEERDHKGITYVKASIADLEPTADFDVILSNQVLSVVPDHEAALASLHGALKARGILVASITHPFFDGVGAGWVAHADREVRWHAHRYMARVEGRSANGAPTYHRSLSDYLQAAVGAGFVLTGFAEVVASDDVSRTLHPNERCFDQIPGLAVMRLRKEGQ